MENLKKSEEIAIAAGQSFKEREYWLNKLSGELVKSYFPYDFSESNIKDTKSASVRFVFPDEDCSRLLRLSNGSDSRLHMILTAVLVILLGNITENEDVIFGMPIEKQEIEGNFVNTVLTLRNDVTLNMTFKELLLQVRKTIYEAVENQNYPIEALLYDLNLDAGETRFPLFDVAICLENIQDFEFIRRLPLGMKFSFSGKDGTIEARLEYDPRLYRETTVHRIGSYYRRVTHQALGDIDIKPADIILLSEEEKDQLLVEFNATKKEHPGQKTIHELFRAMAEKKPDHDALVYGEKRLTYRELNEKSDLLARFLKSKGVDENSVVAVLAERSLEMITGMLGILKAGGAYLPIDPEYPTERKAYMLADSNVKVLLTQYEMEEKIEFNGEIVYLDKDIEDNNSPEEIYAAAAVNGANWAYVIYTSGSTGKPKGVIVEHDAIVNTLQWRKNYYGFDETDAVLQVPSFSFDSSVEDIFTPLISGSRLVLIDARQQFDLEYLREVIAKNEVTHFLMVPNLYKAFLDDLQEPIDSLKTVTIAGESFTGELVERHAAKLQHVELFNEYGPTENSVCSTVYKFTTDNPQVLIGKPIDNVYCFIRDKRGGLSPIGVYGQLYVSGRGLARGYLNAPRLTKEKFFVNPYRPGEKMYATGDYARWLPDGNIQFYGRKDDQVKIRGIRIEIGEIERQLLQYDPVKEVVVTSNKDRRGHNYLTAFMVMDAAAVWDVAGIMGFLSKRLPDYMAPAYYFKIDRLPLTPNGKVDRKQLPEPDGSINTGVEYIAPRDDVEKELSEIWKSELELERVGIKDNYFNIGGDSIKSIRLISIINRKLNKKLKIADLYVNNTIEQMARLIKEIKTDHSAGDYEEALGRIEKVKNNFMKKI